jgi:hypothetical protein
MIDGTIGFHQILSQQKACLAITRISISAPQITEHLDRIIQKTYDPAPVREENYKLSLIHGKEPTERTPERLLERRLFDQWDQCRLTRQEEFLPSVCRCFVGYQVPLANEESDKIWGKIDLLGVSPQWLPVVVELKQEKAKDSPLKMLVEAAKYAIALRKAWQEGCLSERWHDALKRARLNSAYPLEVPLLCAAPTTYWDNISKKRWGTRDKAGEAIGHLVAQMAKRGLPVKWVEFDTTDIKHIGQGKVRTLPF